MDRFEKINYIEKYFYQYAYETFTKNKDSSELNLLNLLTEDKDYLLKYYNKFTKMWLNYLNDDELDDLYHEKVKELNQKINIS